MTATDVPDRPAAGARPGQAVLVWLQGDEAAARARALVRRYDLPGGSATVEDLLGDALVAALRWQQGPAAVDPDNPAAYGTTILRSVARRVLAGRIRAVEGPLSLDDLAVEPADPAGPAIGETDTDTDSGHGDEAGGDLRVQVERMGGPPWLVSAALSVVTFVLHPDSVPADAPAPRAGSRPDQARVWPALDLAGEGHLLPGPDGDPPARRRTRARRITAVLGRLERAAARTVTGGGVRRG